MGNSLVRLFWMYQSFSFKRGVYIVKYSGGILVAGLLSFGGKGARSGRIYWNGHE